MPMEAQTRLLRVLQQGEYTTVGGRTPIKADVRIIAASNKDLRMLIQQGLFREDLFFRLNVVPLRLPPLRERTEDVPDLIRHFFTLVEREGLPPKQIEPAALERLKRHRWPGNVRELENLARRLAALYPQEMITAAVIDAELVAARDGFRPARSRAAEEALSAAVERHLAAYFARFGEELPPPGLYHRMLREVEHPLLVGGAGGNPRQPDPCGRPARGQPQHIAQENPRSRYPGLPRQRINGPRALSAQRPLRHPIWPRCKRLRPGIVAIRQHCCRKASVLQGDRPTCAHMTAQ